MSDETPLGLRERKRRATVNAIEQSAVRIALDEGPAAVTVERICAEAFISRSTFFNHFPSRDAAIYGLPVVIEPGEAFDAALDQWSENVPVGLATAVLQAIGSGEVNSDVARQRLELMARYPEAAEYATGSVSLLRRRLEVLVGDWLERRPDASRLGDAHADAHAIVTIATMIAEEIYGAAIRAEGDLVVGLPELLEASRRVNQHLAAYVTPQATALPE